jgi:SAM-dependent methyltransferase
MIPSQNSAGSVLDSEREFHNRRFKDGDERVAQHKFYWAIEDGAALYARTVERLAKGADVLEYGCGTETMAPRIAGTARTVNAIDISDEAIRHARLDFSADNVTFTVMDAMDLSFPDGSFDLIAGSGIVHHLDTDKAAQQMARTLRPRGKAVFWEPLGLNPAINAYRYLTPSARTPDEHPLLPRDFAIMRRYFPTVDVQFFGLTSIAAVPLRSHALGPHLRQGLIRLDRLAFHIPGLRYLAWFALIECAKGPADG